MTPAQAAQHLDGRSVEDALEWLRSRVGPWMTQWWLDELLTHGWLRMELADEELELWTVHVEER